MYAKRFAIVAAMLLAFAVPSFANHFGTIAATATCSGYSIQFTVLNETGTSHEIAYTFTLHPASGPNIIISGMTTFPTSPSGTTTITVSGTIPALTQSDTIESASAQLFTDGALENTASIPFSTLTVGPCNFTGCSFTQGGWGAKPHGNNPGAILAANFATDFPSGVTIGGFPFALHFTSAVAIQNFLPQGRTPSVLTSSATNPTNSNAGVFAGQVLALALNVGINNMGSVIISKPGSPFDGQTVSALLAAANTALAGGGLPSGFSSISALNDLVDQINQEFDNCNTPS